MRRISVSLLLAITLTYGVSAIGPTHALADPPSFAGGWVWCNNSDSATVNFPTPPPPGADYLYSLVSQGIRGSAATTVGNAPELITFNSGDKIWGLTSDGTIHVVCVTAGTANIYWYQIPSVPVSFTGVISPGSSSTLQALMPASFMTWDQYRMDIAGAGTLMAALGPVSLPYSFTSPSNVPTASTPPSRWVYPEAMPGANWSYGLSAPISATGPVAYSLSLRYLPFNTSGCNALLAAVQQHGNVHPCPATSLSPVSRRPSIRITSRTHRCTNTRIRRGGGDVVARHEIARGISCATMHGLLRPAAVGGSGGLVYRVGAGGGGSSAPPDWNCAVVRQWFSKEKGRSGRPTGARIRCTSGARWFTLQWRAT